MPKPTRSVFRWVMKAKEQGARSSTSIHGSRARVRFADHLGAVRAGTDIVSRWTHQPLIEYELFFREYVVHYTNASCI